MKKFIKFIVIIAIIAVAGLIFKHRQAIMNYCGITKTADNVKIQSTTSESTQKATKLTTAASYGTGSHSSQIANIMQFKQHHPST